MNEIVTEDTTPEIEVEAPTEPGFYKYSGGNQSLIFLLHNGTWYALTDNASIQICEWGYIEQALSVWELVKI